MLRLGHLQGAELEKARSTASEQQATSAAQAEQLTQRLQQEGASVQRLQSALKSAGEPCKDAGTRQARDPAAARLSSAHQQARHVAC